MNLLLGLSIILTLILILELAWILFCYIRKGGYASRLRSLENKLEKIEEQIEYNRQLFDHHFKVTDKTIEEERKEKHYWKAKAEKGT